jgi:hypothetical protein
MSQLASLRRVKRLPLTRFAEAKTGGGSRPANIDEASDYAKE